MAYLQIYLLQIQYSVVVDVVDEIVLYSIFVLFAKNMEALNQNILNIYMTGNLEVF